MSNKKFLNFDNCLLVSPHPDDTEYAMAGTILKYPDTKFYNLIITKGTRGDQTKGSHRLTEVYNFWKNSKNKNIYMFSDLVFQENDIFSEEKIINKLDNVLSDKQFNFDAIFVTPALDNHEEHRIANSAVLPSTRDRPISVIEYKTVSHKLEWVPNLFVDISFYQSKYYHLIDAFKSQMHREYFKKTTFDSFHQNFSCLRRQKEYTEQFRILQGFQ